MRLDPSVSTYRRQTVREQAHPHTHEHTSLHKGERATLWKNVLLATLPNADQITALLSFYGQIQEEASLPACLPQRALSLSCHRNGCWGLAAGQPLPPRCWGSNLQKSLMMPLWATTHHVPLLPAGQGQRKSRTLTK